LFRCPYGSFECDGKSGEPTHQALDATKTEVTSWFSANPPPKPAADTWIWSARVVLLKSVIWSMPMLSELNAKVLLPRRL
jgi:murein endopeptidase